MANTEQELGRRRKRKLEGFENWKQWSNFKILELMESRITDVVSGDRGPPNNARRRTKLAQDKAKVAWIIKSDVSDALFLRIQDDNDPKHVGIPYEKHHPRLVKTLFMSFFLKPSNTLPQIKLKG